MSPFSKIRMLFILYNYRRWQIEIPRKTSDKTILKKDKYKTILKLFMMQGRKIVKTASKPVSKSWNKIIKRNLTEPSYDWFLSTLLYNYKISWQQAESFYNMVFKDNVQIPLVTKDQILKS